MSGGLDRSPYWFSDEFNAALFESLGICFSHIQISDEEMECDIMGLCGAVKVSVPASLTSLQEDTTRAQLLSYMRASTWYREYLEDLVFDYYRKSDLVRALNTDLFLPTQLKHGPQWWWQPDTHSLAVGKEVIVFSHIRHAMRNGVMSFDFLRGEIPAADEFYIWQDVELVTARLPLELMPLREAVEVLTRAIVDGPGSSLGVESNWCLYQPSNLDVLAKPLTVAELFKYHQYYGINSGHILEE